MNVVISSWRHVQREHGLEFLHEERVTLDNVTTIGDIKRHPQFLRTFNPVDDRLFWNGVELLDTYADEELKNISTEDVIVIDLVFKEQGTVKFQNATLKDIFLIVNGVNFLPVGRQTPIAITSKFRKMFKDRTKVYNFGLSVKVVDLGDGKEKHYYRKFEMAKNEHTDGSKIVIQKIPRKSALPWWIQNLLSLLPWKIQNLLSLIQTDHGDDIEVVLKGKDDKVVPDGIKEVEEQGRFFDYRNMTRQEILQTAAAFIGPPLIGAIPGLAALGGK